MRIVAVEALEILVLVVVDISTVSTMIMMHLLLLLSKSLHSMIHVARYGTAARIYVWPSLHLLGVHCDGVIGIHYRTLKLSLFYSLASFLYFFLQIK
jgi:hypothetical protein